MILGKPLLARRARIHAADSMTIMVIHAFHVDVKISWGHLETYNTFHPSSLFVYERQRNMCLQS